MKLASDRQRSLNSLPFRTASMVSFTFDVVCAGKLMVWGIMLGLIMMDSVAPPSAQRGARGTVGLHEHPETVRVPLLKREHNVTAPRSRTRSTRRLHLRRHFLHHGIEDAVMEVHGLVVAVVVFG